MCGRGRNNVNIMVFAARCGRRYGEFRHLEYTLLTASICFRCFGPKCAGCGQGILPQDYVRKAREQVYHLRCFTCSVCGKQLSTGEVLYLQPGEDNTLLCKDDYLKQNGGTAGKFKSLRYLNM